MNKKEPGLIYHSLHGRGFRGCFPLSLLLAALAVTGILMVLNVRMPGRIRPKGEGQVYYRNDTLLHFQIRHRTPLLLNMPAYVDPSRHEPAAIVKQDGRVEATLLPAPTYEFLSTPPDSAVLSDEDLLALPPAAEPQPEVLPVEEPQPAPAADPQPAPADSGEEVQP